MTDAVAERIKQEARREFNEGVQRERDKLPSPSARIHEITMALASRQAVPPEHSVELSRNAKGVAQFAVTARGFDLDEVLTEARAAFDSLAAEYPYPNGNGSTE